MPTLDQLMKGRVTQSESGKVYIPATLSQFAQSANLTLGQTLLLRDLQSQIIAYRSRSKTEDLEKVDWRRFYETVKGYIK